MDARANHESDDVPEEQGFITTGLPEWARERAEGQWYEPPAAGRSSPQEQPKAPDKLIVVVPEKGDDWAKARVFDNSGQATALVKTLVEGGLAPERVSIFSATQLVVDVAYRPVVELKKRRKQKKSSGRA